MGDDSDKGATPMRDFALGEILSVTTGILLCDIGKMHELLEYMTGEAPFTHQLGRFAAECRPEIIRQHPQLVSVDATRVGRENWSVWLGEQVARYGAALPLSPITAHVVRNPVEELSEMIGPEKVVTVIVPVSGQAPLPPPPAAR